MVRAGIGVGSATRPAYLTSLESLDQPMLLQRGASLSEIGHSLATAPLWGGEDVPASPVGAIVAEMQAEEGEA